MTYDDKQLLELAAKAAGIKIDKSPYTGGGQGNTGFDLLGNAVVDWHNGKKWNPLTDDGDALRLAVGLGLSVEVIKKSNETRVMGYVDYVAVKHEGGPYAATRRAITSAAAAIGKAMP